MIFSDFLMHYHKLRETDVEPTAVPGWFKVVDRASGAPVVGGTLQYTDGGEDPFKTWKRMRRAKTTGQNFGRAFRGGLKI